MKIIIHNDVSKIAEINSRKIILNDVQDALDLMVNPDVEGSRKFIIFEKNINPVFFQLSSGLAGEILQKFINYQIKLAIIGDFSKYTSKSLHDFIYESNKGGQIYFLQDIDTAKKRLLSD